MSQFVYSAFIFDKHSKIHLTSGMIPDKIFKGLPHESRGYKMLMNGNTLERGYKPDYVLKKDNDYIILESENSSSRKTYVGGMMKAAHFLQDEKTGTLVFINVSKKNTTANAIANHLKKYLLWVADKTNLKQVYVIEATHYYKNEVVLTTGHKDFRKVAIKV